MNKTMISRTLLSSALTLLVSTALAQQTRDRTTQQDRTGQPGATPRSSYSTTTSSSMDQSGKLFRSTQLMGSTVQSSHGATLGQIRDIAVDPQSGRVEFAILSLSGVSGTSTSRPSSTTPDAPSTTPGASTTTTPGTSTTTPGIGASATSSASYGMGKLVAVPWQLLSVSSGTSTSTSTSRTTPGITSSTARIGGLASSPTFVLNTDESKLQSAPSIDQTSWNELQQENFGQRVFSHYGLDWSSRSSGVGGTGTGTTRGSGTGAGTTKGSETDPGTTRPDRQ